MGPRSLTGARQRSPVRLIHPHHPSTSFSCTRSEWPVSHDKLKNNARAMRVATQINSLTVCCFSWSIIFSSCTATANFSWSTITWKYRGLMRALLNALPL